MTVVSISFAFINTLAIPNRLKAHYQFLSATTLSVYAKVNVDQILEVKVSNL